MEINGKRVLCCGMAKSGIAAAHLAKQKGALVTLQDYKKKETLDASLLKQLREEGIELYLGQNPDEIVAEQDLIIVSPGIPTDLPFFARAKEAGVPIISEVEFAYWYTPCPVVAITGTNGKTTTTALTGELLKAKYPGVAVVGNIGVPYAAEVSRLTKDDYVVAEISSFQMETADTFHPHIAAVLNITPDHLDRHKTLENYIAMKERIFRRQDAQDFLILNASDPVTLAMAKKSKAKPVFFSSQAPLEEGIFLQQGHIILSKEGSQTDLIDVKECQLLGVHNYENMMAAVAMALCAGVDVEQIRQGLRQFRGVAHRIEYVRTVDGVDYYNDSKGTNVDAAIRGILAMEKPCVLLGGGYVKGAEYDSWLELFDGRVKKLILLGQTAQKIAACCDRHGFTAYEFAQTFDEALQKAKQAAQQGDCVLLSPACASWGMFDNYEQRGDLFKAWVRAL